MQAVIPSTLSSILEPDTLFLQNDHLVDLPTAALTHKEMLRVGVKIGQVENSANSHVLTFRWTNRTSSGIKPYLPHLTLLKKTQALQCSL